MGRRKADTKHIETIHDRAEIKRARLEEELQEDRQKERRIAAAMTAAGVFLSIRTAEMAVSEVLPPDAFDVMFGLFDKLIQGKDATSVLEEKQKEIFKPTPLAVGLSLYAAGMVLSGNDPATLVEAVIPDSIL